MGWRRFGVTSQAGLGKDHVDAASVPVAQASLNKPVPFQPPDQPGQRALAQVHAIGQFLRPELVLPALGQALEDLELADAQLVPPTKLVFEGGAGSRMASDNRPPGFDELIGVGARLRASYLVGGRDQAFPRCPISAGPRLSGRNLL